MLLSKKTFPQWKVVSCTSTLVVCSHCGNMKNLHYHYVFQGIPPQKRITWSYGSLYNTHIFHPHAAICQFISEHHKTITEVSCWLTDSIKVK